MTKFTRVVGTFVALLLATGLYATTVYAPSHPEFATTIRVSLFEWGISLEESEMVEGGVIFEVVNEGTMDHAFKIGGLPAGTAETEVFSPGSVRTLYVQLPPGRYEIWCPISGHRELGMETTLQVLRELPQPMPGSTARDFDSNGDCFINNTELFAAVDLWINADIGNALFFEVVDAWIADLNVCAAAMGANTNSQITTRMSASDAVVFSTWAEAVHGVTVQVYDLSGRVLFDETSNGQQLVWNLRDSNGAKVPNGVYLYRAGTRGSDGSMHAHAPVRKLLVMR